MKISSYGGRDNNLSINFNTPEELNSFMGALKSHMWVQWSDDEKKLITAPAHKEPPLTEDIVIQETFFSWLKGPVSLQVNYKDRSNSDPAIFVQHIQGYDHDSYTLKAEKLEAVGFDVMRSKRGDDGKVWEIWYLPGVWAAKGELKNCKFKKILDWICHEIAPGQISVEGRTLGLRNLD